MKKILLAMLTVVSMTANVLSYAETQAIMTPGPAPKDTTALSFQPTAWVSKNSTDNVIVHNGNGGSLVIEIIVSGSAPNAPGVTIKNCGSTTTIKAGDSAICSSDDPANPVTFSSDNQNLPASGTYTTKQK